MSKFNQLSKPIGYVPPQLVTQTHEGGIGYIMDAKTKLMTQVMTSFFGEPKYYGGMNHNDEIVKGIREMITIDARFVANLGVYAREVLNLRSVTHVIAAELAHYAHHLKEGMARKAIARMVKRPDDMTEIFAYYLSVYTTGLPNPSPYGARPPKGVGNKLPKHTNKAIPNSLKKGLGDAFKRFDEYTLQKYNGGARQDKEVKLRDIYLVCRPTPSSQAQYEMWRRLIADELEMPKTWETQLATRGNTREVWEELLAGNQVGYMALLRNLRNITKADVRNMDLVLAKLTNKQAVLHSKQLPFRFLTAYKMAQEEGWGTSELLQALEQALATSALNIQKLPGVTFWTADASASMRNPISEKSTMRASEIAMLLMSIGNYISDQSITTLFATGFRKLPVSVNDGILSNAQKFNTVNIGHGTNGHLPIEYLYDNKIFVDRIVVLSDNQVNSSLRSAQSTLERYRHEINPSVWIHAIDMMGYGNQQFTGLKVNIITGWSDKVLDFIRMAEQGSASMVQTIEAYAY